MGDYADRTAQLEETYARIRAATDLRIVVEKGAPTLAERLWIADRIDATRIYVMATDARTCHHRVKQRARPAARQEHRSIHGWWARYQPHPAHGPPPDPHAFRLTPSPISGTTNSSSRLPSSW